MAERRTDNIYLTVVISVWNRGREIARSLGSVTKQLCCVPCPRNNLSHNVGANRFR